MREIEGGITAPEGFKAAGVHCGIKKNRPDLALIYSEVPAVAYGMFTTNKVKAAPVHLSIRKIRKGRAQAIVANSGNANACTGQRGMKDAQRMAGLAAQLLEIEEEKVLVASTGIIGKPLPMPKIEEGIKQATQALSVQGGRRAAEAILTTDRALKEIAVETDISRRGKGKVRIAGMAKGSGMISPNLATMLCFITTDACITELAGNKRIKTWRKKKKIRVEDENFHYFCQALDHICISLAKMIVRDGEGATKLVEVEVNGAPFQKDARRIGRAVATSPLVKAAIAGSSPNWGRVIAALGAAHTKINPHKDRCGGGKIERGSKQG